jgi:hypothetical protein
VNDATEEHLGFTYAPVQDPKTWGGPAYQAAMASSSNPPDPYGQNPYAWPVQVTPIPKKPKAKLGDKRPGKVCTFCKNPGRIVVAHVDGFEVRVMCKLCGKAEVEK